MSSLMPFAEATHSSALKLAWEKVQRNNGCAGGDGQGIAGFAMMADRAIVALAERLANGSYRPRALRHHRISKDDGSFRPLTIPSVSDRIVQTSVARVLTPLAEATFSDASFGYRPGRSVQMATDRVSALRRAGFDHVLEADVERAFENVAHDPILTRLEALLAEASDGAQMVDLIAMWLDHASEAMETPGRGLAQGSPLSPLLFNLLLDGLDDRFSEGPARIVRFADDFLILTRSDAAADQALMAATTHLAELGLLAGRAGAFRRQRPAEDPLNACLNYLTALLARDVRGALLTAGLHPGFGMLHATDDRREAAVWDLIEPFRALLAEGPVVGLFNRNRLQDAMFQAAPSGRVTILAEGRRALIRTYEERMARTAKSIHTGHTHKMRRILLETARAYARHLRNPATVPFILPLQDY